MPVGPEHNLVRLPLLEKLRALGWSDEQIQHEPEWRVPKNPSQASKRELGGSFDGFPVDITLFDATATGQDWERVLVLFELKRPNRKEGRAQLETLLSLEPRARVGFWTNGTDQLALYRRADGTFDVVHDAPVPRPDDNFSLEAKTPLRWSDLVEPQGYGLRERLERVFGSVVSRDTKSTRSDDRLNQICNLLLVKLESDKQAKNDPGASVLFQPSHDEAVTAKKVRAEYAALRNRYPEIFASTSDVELQLDDHTIHEVVFELAKVKLVDVSTQTIAEAFQVFRARSLKSGEGQYFTPSRVISSAIRFLDVTPADKVIDPACGTGGFLVESLVALRERYPSMSEADLRTWAHRNLFGVDKDDISVKLTRAIMQIVGDGSANVFVGDSIRSHAWPNDYPHLTQPLRDGQFSVVVTNPPFGQSYKVDARDCRLSDYSISIEASKTGKHRDLEIGIVFLERAYRLLEPGGRLGIVLPETYFFSSTYSWLRSWLEPRLALRGMLNIPMEAFQGFCRAKTNFYVFERLPDVPSS
jgi:type I restriction-modification system DNA methylase subunit